MFEDKEFQDHATYIGNLALTLLNRDTRAEWGVRFDFSGWQANVHFNQGNFRHDIMYDAQEKGMLLNFFAQLKYMRDQWKEWIDATKDEE